MNSLNNQMVVCPNYHSIIHDMSSIYDRKRMMFLFNNSVEEMLVLDKHLV